MLLLKVKKLSPEAIDYFDACSRIRDTSRTRLCERLLETIARDHLVLGILDDDSRPTREKHKHRYRPPAGVLNPRRPDGGNPARGRTDAEGD